MRPSLTVCTTTGKLETCSTILLCRRKLQVLRTFTVDSWLCTQPSMSDLPVTSRRLGLVMFEALLASLGDTPSAPSQTTTLLDETPLSRASLVRTSCVS